MKAGTAPWARALLALALLGLVLVGACSEREGAAHSRAAQAEPAEGAEPGNAGGAGAGGAGDQHAQEAESKEQGVELSPERLRAQGVVVAPLEPRRVPETVRAPAQIEFNESRRVAITARAGGWAE